MGLFSVEPAKAALREPDQSAIPAAGAFASRSTASPIETSVTGGKK